MAAPARHEDDPTDASLQPQAKGKKYYPKEDDTRKTNKRGPTTRKLRTRPRTSKRDIFPGSKLLNINTLYEEYEATYSDTDEIKLLENTKDIRKLIMELETKEAETKNSESKA